MTVTCLYRVIARLALTLGPALLTSACLPAVGSLMPGELPVTRWDGTPEAASWTGAAMLAVTAKDEALAAQVPTDIDTYCPGYETASMAERRSFWVQLVALTARRESGFNPAAAGAGKYFGLMQISPRTADYAGCGVSTAAELKDGENNLFCAVEIMSRAVARDGMVSGPKGTKGIGADWGPWRSASMRAEAQDWFADQPYCKG